MSGDSGHTTSKTQVRQTDDGSYTQIGVTVNGAWFPFAQYTTAEFAERLREQAEADAAAKADKSDDKT